MRTLAKNILVANSKGGCGKTTIATNLAVAYALRGELAALVDCDPQASSHHWHEARDQELVSVPVTVDQQLGVLSTSNSGTTIIDARLQSGDSVTLERMIKFSDLIIVPILPSALDIRAGERFITNVMTHRAFHARPRPIAIVCNRVAGYSSGYEKLVQFLDCLSVPVIAEFRDSPVYVEAANLGTGLLEMKDNRAARKEYRAWRQMLSWIDTQERLPRQRNPLAAGRSTRAVTPSQRPLSAAAKNNG